MSNPDGSGRARPRSSGRRAGAASSSTTSPPQARRRRPDGDHPRLLGDRGRLPRRRSGPRRRRAATRDLAPEGVTFVPAEDSPVANPFLCVGYEVSGTVGVFEVTPETGTCGVSTRPCAASRRRASDARPPSVGDRFGWTRRDLVSHDLDGTGSKSRGLWRSPYSSPPSVRISTSTSRSSSNAGGRSSSASVSSSSTARFVVQSVVWWWHIAYVRNGSIRFNVRSDALRGPRPSSDGRSGRPVVRSLPEPVRPVAVPRGARDAVSRPRHGRRRSRINSAIGSGVPSPGRVPPFAPLPSTGV